MSKRRGVPTVVTIVALAGGSNACALLATYSDNKERVIRITDAQPEKLDFQEILHAPLTPFIPVSDPPESVRFLKLTKLERDAMKLAKDCDDNYTLWRTNNTQLWRYRMDFAKYGDLGKASRAHPEWREDVYCQMTFLLIGFQYVAQILYGFEHGDITEKNIVVTDRQGAPFAQMIDFDFGSWMGNSRNPRRPLGTPRYRPYEFIQYGINEDDPRRSVSGAVDIWALGLVMLLRALGNAWDAINVRNYGKIPRNTENDDPLDYLCVGAIISLLNDADEATFSRNFRHKDDESNNNGAQKHAIFGAVRQRYRIQLERLPLALKTVLRRMLDLDPVQRTFDGDLAQYFRMDYFANYSDALLETFIRPLLAGYKGYPTLNSNQHRQIQNMHSIGAPLLCYHCHEPAAYFDSHLNTLVCDAATCGKN
jgi:serine/threonine protein kinase